MNQNVSDKKYTVLLIVMSVLFFMVGFITTMNNSLIDFLASSKWMLSFSEKQFVNTAFFGAYLFSVPLSFVLSRLGYKVSAVLSLLVTGAGFVLACWAVGVGYVAFLASMFVVALGIALLQIVLNPYVLALGRPEEAASRLNLVGFFNSFATVTAPLFVAMIISVEQMAGGVPSDSRPDPTNVQQPFLVIAGIALALSLLLYFLRLPEIKASSDKSTDKSSHKYPHLWFGALAIFVYMGVEIGIPSFLPDRMKALQVEEISFMGKQWIGIEVLAIYWGGLMLGRLLGALVLKKVKVRVAMLFCSLMAMLFLGGSLVLKGETAVILMLLCGFFNSIMWGSIFNLALEGLGSYTERASGIVCSFAIGGAVLPPLMGLLQQSFGERALTVGTSVALGCLFLYYLYIILFVVRLSVVRKIR